MTELRIKRERLAWTVVVAVLATSLAWLAVIDVALLTRASTAGFSTALTVARALFRAGLLLARTSWPILPVALLALGLLAVLADALAPERPQVGGARHG